MKRLIDYLNAYAWSQAELARRADIAPSTVARALAGNPIARRNADKIVMALEEKHKAIGGPGHIVLASVRGLKITDTHRNTRRKKKPEQERSPFLV